MTAACAFGLSAAIALAMPDGADVVLRDDANADASAKLLFGRSQWREAVK